MASKKGIPMNFDLKKTFEKLSKNYWAISTIVLAIILIINFGGSFGTTLSADEVGQKVVDFAKNQGADLKLIEVKDDGQFYEVTVEIEGQQFPLYATKDGKMFTQQLIPMDENPQQNTQQQQNTPPPTQTNIPKYDKPVVELFVMSHCPYGTQMEKGMLPVWNLLKNDIDFKLKFVYYAMHPSQGEVEEQLNQYCIQEEQNDKFRDYLTCFLEKGDGSSCLTSIGIDKTKLKTCTDKADKEFKITENLNDKSSWLSGNFPLFNTHKADNEKYSIGGSPTLIINGVKASSGRDSASILSTICGAFNTAPELCKTELSSAAPSPGFGFNEASASNNAAAAAACGI